MKAEKWICSIAIIFSFSILLVSILFAAGEQAPPASGAVYVSFLWAGKSDTNCMLRDTLLTDTTAECEQEYSRAEAEIKELVKHRNERGSGWKWGVFSKCSLYPDTNAYNQELDKLRKRCMGK
jgi:hypothetical protein